ncbi:MAG TPA: hypothetical protein VN182_05500, partial [Flavobacterium sp.]|nr:hypothetical protein [Flavobacterium sp.]
FELKAILKKIESRIITMSNTKFPISLSLFQILFGILVQEKILTDENILKSFFFKPESFYVIFPDLKEKKLNTFTIS